MEKIYIDGHRVSFSNGTGYPTISINRKNISVHRYVWEKEFGPIPKGYVVHHKDCNRNNFDLSNLQLMSESEHHSMHMKKFRQEHPLNPDFVEKFAQSRRKKVLCVEKGEIFDSIKAASKATNAPYGHIGSVCKGKRETSGGYHWRYVE